MTDYPPEVKELIEAAIEYIDRIDGHDSFIEWNKLKNAADKFRPKPPRTGTLVIKTPAPVFPNATTVINDGGIELTDEVRARLGPSGGLDEHTIAEMAVQDYMNRETGEGFSWDYAQGIAKRVMALIADAGIKWEETT